MTLSFRTIVRGSLAVFGLTALAAQGANAVTVNTIFNTGVTTQGTPVASPGNTVLDTHYTVAVGTTATPTVPITAGATPATVLDANGQPVVFYSTGNTGTSSYISTAMAASANSTFVDFRTTFNLTGFQPATASLGGSLFADNGVFAVFLNNVNTGLTFTQNNFSTFQTFTISSGFGAGVNTLDFVVLNGPSGNPNFLALNVNNLVLNATAIPPVVTPEPGSVAMLIGMSITGAGFLSRRKRAIK